jgi:putative phosphoesterase
LQQLYQTGLLDIGYWGILLMKVIILSDSHGSFGALKKIVESERPFDLLIHLGDGLEDLLRLSRMVDFQFDGVNGNGDPPGMYPVDLTLNLGGHICFFTHGHHYGVHQGFGRFVAAAKKNKARYAFFGHTHQPFQEPVKGIQVFNPGSICFYLSPSPSYIRWEVGVDKPLRKQLNQEID